jgi:hypothetical protein
MSPKTKTRILCQKRTSLSTDFFFVDEGDDTRDESDYDSEEAAENKLNELNNEAALIISII